MITMRRPSRSEEAEAFIAGLIARDELLPGRRLPSEEALTTMVGASRATIRSALLALERRGVILRRHGIGTFATGTSVSIEMSLDVLSTIEGLIRSNGFEPRMQKVLIGQDASVPTSIREQLRIGPDEAVYRIERLYLADDAPAIYVTNRLPMQVNGRTVDLSRFRGEVLTFLEAEFGWRIDRAVSQVTAVEAPKGIAQALGVSTGSPLLLLEQVAYTTGDQPIAHSLAYHRSRYITYSVTRRPLVSVGKQIGANAHPEGSP